MRRPLLCALLGLAAAVTITISCLPWEIADYEPWRGMRVCLVGRVCGIEPRRQEDQIVWRMLLSDVETDATAGIPAPASPGGQGQEASAGQGAGLFASGRAATEDSVFAQQLSLGKRDRVLCLLDREPQLDIGARAQVRGKVIPFRRAMNEGEFDSRLYYHILRIEFSMRDTEILAASETSDQAAASLYHLKKNISGILDRYFSSRNAPVLQAMLLGEKGLLEEDTKELYQGAGIIHILSISGLHLSLIGMGLFSLLMKLRAPLPPALCGFMSLCAVLAYGNMVGMGTSVIRALVMLSFYILARVVGRTYDLVTAASIALVLLLFDQPLYLLHTGYLFSFAAVFSIGVLMPAIPRSQSRSRGLRDLPGRLLQGLAVPLGTLPVYLWAYGTFPPYSILLNLAVVPLMAFAMAGAGVAAALWGIAEFVGGRMGGPGFHAWAGAGAGAGAGGIFSLASQALPILSPVRWPGLPVEAILDLYRFLAQASLRLPGHELVLGRPAPGQVALYYGMLVFLGGVSSRLQMPHVQKGIRERGSGKLAGGKGRGPGTGPARRQGRERLEPALGGRGCGPGTGPARRQGRERLEPALGERGCRVAVRHAEGPKNVPPAQAMDAALMLAAGGLCRIFRAFDNRERRALGRSCIAFWMFLSATVLLLRFRPPFEMDVLYVGQGDGIFISCEGTHFLIDGGSSTKDRLAKYTLLPFLHCKGVRRLDGIILTHDDIDHCSGILELLEGDGENPTAGRSRLPVQIGALYLPDIAQEAKGEKYQRIEALAAGASIPVLYISRGQRILAGNLTMECLHPGRGASYEDANAASTTLLLQYKGSGALHDGSQDSSQGGTWEAEGFSALLTGDLEKRGEEDLLDYMDRAFSKDWRDAYPNLDVLKVAHHGSKSATSEAFLEKFHPATAIISAGIDNIYGHPHEETLQRLAANMGQGGIFRTDLRGEIRVTVGRLLFRLPRTRGVFAR